MTPQTFRKKPVEIQAIQLNWRNWSEVCEFLGDVISPQNPAREIGPEAVSDTCDEPGPTYIEITVTTVHGEPAIVRHGDWIIAEPMSGRFYPCKPDIFEATYADPATSPQTPGVVVGYKQQQTQHAIDAVNHTKRLENELGDWIEQMRANPDVVPLDEEWTKTAVTHLQIGFMALNRAVFQPESQLR